MTGEGFAPPRRAAQLGRARPPRAGSRHDGQPAPRVGILFYRAQFAADNIAYVQALADAVDAAGGIGVPVHVSSLREARALTCWSTSRHTTCSSRRCSQPAAPSPRRRERRRGRRGLGRAGPRRARRARSSRGCASRGAASSGRPATTACARSTWRRRSPCRSSTAASSPMPFSFKETDARAAALRARPRAVRPPRQARRQPRPPAAHAAGRAAPGRSSCRPTRPSTRASATPSASTPRSRSSGCCGPCATAGYDLGAPGEIPGTGPLDPVDGETPDTTAGNALIHALIEAGGQDEDWLTRSSSRASRCASPLRAIAPGSRRCPPSCATPSTEHWGPAPGSSCSSTAAARPRRRDRAGRAARRQRRDHGAAAARLRREPHRDLPRPRPAADATTTSPPTRLAGERRLRRRTPWCTWASTATSSGCRARSSRCRRAAAPTRRSATSRSIYPFLVNDPGEGTPGQAPRARDDRRPPRAADGPGRVLRRHRPARAAARRVRATSPRWTRPSCRPSAAQIWTLIQAAKLDHDLGLDRPARRRGVRRLRAARRRLAVRGQGRADPRRPAHPGPGPRGRGAASTWCSAILRARQMWAGDGRRRARPARGARASPRRHAEPRARDARRGTGPRAGRARWTRPAGTPRRAAVVARGLGADAAVDPRRAPVAAPSRRRGRAAAGRHRPTRSTHVLHALDGGYVPAGPSGSPLRGLVNVLPTGRNFYSVDPKAIPSRLAWETGAGDGRLAAGALPRPTPASGRGRSGCRCGARRRCAPSGDDIAEVLALLGVRPRLGRGVAPGRPGSRSSRSTELGRPRVDVTVRICGFFRDAFPHVVAMLDDAVRLGRRRSTSPPSENYVRAHVAGRPGRARRRAPRHHAHLRLQARRLRRRLLPLIDGRQLARRRRPRRGLRACGAASPTAASLDGVPARGDMERAYRADRGRGEEHRHPRARHRRLRRLLPVPRRHDRHRPRADRHARPGLHRRLAPRPTPCAPGRSREETARVFRARVVNPRWIAAMRGTATRARSSSPPPSTTCSATTPPPASSPTGCTRSSPQTYVLDPENRDVPRRSQPVGAARHHRAAAGGGRPRPVGGARPRDRCASCSRSTSTSRATSRTDRESDPRARTGLFPQSRERSARARMGLFPQSRERSARPHGTPPPIERAIRAPARDSSLNRESDPRARGQRERAWSPHGLLSRLQLARIALSIDCARIALSICLDWWVDSAFTPTSTGRSMAHVLLFHHAQGQTPGFLAVRGRAALGRPHRPRA